MSVGVAVGDRHRGTQAWLTINCSFAHRSLDAVATTPASSRGRCGRGKGEATLTTRQLLMPHQSQYFAWLLTRRAAGETVESPASTLVDSQVDLNPHQVEATLFACRDPLSRGVILADEVGLGKTIEAGLVISQRWAERRRKVLIIVPANLRKQWHQELQEKFGLQGLILEAKSYNAIRKQEHLWRRRPGDATLRRCRGRNFDGGSSQERAAAPAVPSELEA